ncbi:MULTISPECIES: hypothetical protein [Pacificibacter]|uniref:hypothetical protein n=1 Tax=Pacificibacter TaxID=1042323 RepID=UPI001C081DC1|nr:MULTISPECIES: hypothetical protein [Pacificibacter]MBU2935076.1 hypothetical protein [Pacificibacter marinus]MDO6615866.1 hypothetical protein [Pacificibacter sp. 1_MG-2023]
MLRSLFQFAQAQSSRFIAVYILVWAFAAALIAILQPEYNWDVIGYVASGLSFIGLSGVSLHELTYADVESAVRDFAVFDALTSGKEYRAGVALDPIALEQQLPFYQTRVLYIWLSLAVFACVPTLSFATVLVSGCSAAISLWVSHRLFAIRGWWTALLLPIGLYFGGLDVLADKSSPDALSVCLVMTALLVASKKPRLGVVLFAVLPLLRTDYVILVYLSPILFWGAVRWTAIAASLSVALVIYMSLNMGFGNYGYLHIFNFTLIQGPQVYPVDMTISKELSDYLAAYTRGARRFWETGNVPALVLASGCMIYNFVKAPQFLDRAMLTLLLFGLAHFVLFPVGFERFYVLTLVFCFGYAVKQVDRYVVER